MIQFVMQVGKLLLKLAQAIIADANGVCCRLSVALPLQARTKFLYMVKVSGNLAITQI